MTDGSGLYTYVRGNPVLFADPRGLAVYLEQMNETQRVRALELLQALTNDILGIEEIKVKAAGSGCSCGGVPGAPSGGETTRYKVVVIGQQTDRALVEGTKLVRGLVADEKREIRIKQGAKDQDEADPLAPGEAVRTRQGVPGKGSGTQITFDLSRADGDWLYWVGDSAAGVAKWEAGPRYIALGHELVHAERNLRGVKATESDVENPNSPGRGKMSPQGLPYSTHESPDELETIGAPGYSNLVTENDLRREHHLDERLSHNRRSKEKK